MPGAEPFVRWRMLAAECPVDDRMTDSIFSCNRYGGRSNRNNIAQSVQWMAA